MEKSKNFLLLCSFLLIFAGILIGCGGSGGGNSDTNSLNQSQTSNLQVSKSTFNFGNVTLGNTATLSVILKNTGSGNLSISNISLSNNTDFAIDSSECGSSPYMIASGMNCAVRVSFSPTVEGSYSESLSITSNDVDTPTATFTLSGEGKTISAYSVALNQIETNCTTSMVTAYVSVTDQDGFAVTDLTLDNFTIFEDGGTPIVPESVDLADSATFPLSVAILMDYSGSIYDVTDLIEIIENSVSNLVVTLGADDQAEIIKFDRSVQRTQGFTTDKELLNSAIYEVPVSIESGTALFNSIYQGIDDAANTLTSRRAVLVLTDGNNTVKYGATLSSVIDLGKDLGVPVFTVGVGQNVNTTQLNQIASETGGQFFDCPDMDRVQTIYAQLSELLNNQYIVTYASVGTGADVNTVVSIQHAIAGGGIISKDSNALTYSSCP